MLLFVRPWGGSSGPRWVWTGPAQGASTPELAVQLLGSFKSGNQDKKLNKIPQIRNLDFYFEGRRPGPQRAGNESGLNERLVCFRESNQARVCCRFCGKRRLRLFPTSAATFSRYDVLKGKITAGN